MVDNVYADKAEDCILYGTKNGEFTKKYLFLSKGGVPADTLPNELESHGTASYYYLCVELGPNVQKKDTYYFTGTSWAICSNSEHAPKK